MKSDNPFCENCEESGCLVSHDGTCAQIRKYQNHLLAQKLVNEQAEDEGLWFQAKYITESHLQQELRKLHSAIED